MPIQIDEIVIRALVGDRAGEEGGSPAGAEIDREAIVAECVEQVMEILKEKSER